MLRHAEAGFEDGKLTLTLGDSFITRSRAPRIGEWLKELYQERFGIALSVSYVYQEIPERIEEEANEGIVEQGTVRATATGTEEGRARSADRQSVSGQQEGGSSASQSSVGKRTAENGMASESREEKSLQAAASARGDSAVYPTARGAAQPAKKKSMFSVYSGSGSSGGGGKDGQRPYRRKLPDDPDVFYGKAFEGEARPISELNDGSGEVIVQWQLLKVDEK